MCVGISEVNRQLRDYLPLHEMFDAWLVIAVEGTFPSPLPSLPPFPFISPVHSFILPLPHSLPPSLTHFLFFPSTSLSPYLDLMLAYPLDPPLTHPPALSTLS